MTVNNRNHLPVVVPQELQLAPGLQLFTASSPDFECYAYIPQHLPDPSRVLVCVHGVSRNALEQIQIFRPYAERYGFALIAPLFTAAIFRDYQRLGRQGHGPRADLALIRVLQTIALKTPLNTSKVALFGFSGGAQFVHRFAFAHSQRVSSIVLGAAGWYTMPDTNESYPFGTANAKGLDAVRLNVRAATRLPILVVVGSEDADANDPELNCSAKVLQQGPNRLARAKNWVGAMNAYASRHGGRANLEFRVLPGIGHSCSDAVLTGDLGELMFGFLAKNAGDHISRNDLQLVSDLQCTDKTDDFLVALS